MQKLTGISSGQNNKSCGIFHHKSNKISFTFFCFFYDFLRNLQDSGIHFYYWSSPFAVRTLERKLALQCSPWARLDGAGDPILARSLPYLAGERLGRGLWATRVRFGALDRGGAVRAMQLGGAREYGRGGDRFR
jgi:hypothetical protein